MSRKWRLPVCLCDNRIEETWVRAINGLPEQSLYYSFFKKELSSPVRRGQLLLVLAVSIPLAVKIIWNRYLDSLLDNTGIAG